MRASLPWNNILFEHFAGQQAAVDAGAPAAIVAAMQAHAGNVALFLRWAAALLAISPAVSRRQAGSCRCWRPSGHSCGHAGACGNAHVSAEMAAALLVISPLIHPVGQQAAVDAGAPAAIVAAMQTHAGKRSCCSEKVAALWK